MSAPARLMGAAALLVLLALFGRPLLRYADTHLFHEALKDTAGRWWWREDWDQAPVLQAGADASWLQGRPLRIAHALGSAGRSDANSLGAMQALLKEDWTHFEVDVWLDAEGRLRCHHGPAAPAPLRPSDCTFERLLTLLDSGRHWIILDIKTDFQRTGQRILAAAQARSFTGRLVFQLYQPSDVLHFAAWQASAPLPAPILTAYDSRRSLNELLGQAQRLHMGALTFPLERAGALSRAAGSVSLLVHPVHDCAAWSTAAALKVAGIYALRGLACDPGADTKKIRAAQ